MVSERMWTSATTSSSQEARIIRFYFILGSYANYFLRILSAKSNPALIMSSFKRKGKQALPSYPGTRISPASNLSLITSTGISSLDDILGGGLPLSCSLVFAAPDIHSSYGELIEKYFVAQGLAVGHSICVVSEDPEGFMRDVMWFAKGQNVKSGNDSEEEDKSTDQSQKVKIAWRYEKMKQFQTTVGDSNQCAVQCVNHSLFD